MEISALVMRKLHESFRGPDSSAEATAALELYVEHAYEAEHERVLLAILKLAEGRESELLGLVEAALLDYRDVLAAAEYPEQMKLGFGADPNLLAAAQARDLAQYRRWLGDDR